ncbi:MAG: SbmA/BacA-like family transporter [Legionellaceae bacterium]|nr:SbmA/BacA-like family transporter [Legionellaceae bacterium]
MANFQHLRCTTLSNAWRLCLPFWRSDAQRTALFYFSAALFCVIGGIYTRIQLNIFNKDFYDALQRFDQPAITQALFNFVGLVLLLLLFYGYAFYCNGVLSLRWRQWLTHHYLLRWLKHASYYRLNFLNIENLDQRISEDLEQLADITINLITLIFSELLSFISFAYILWKLSHEFSVSVFGLHFSGYLLWATLLYGLFGLGITYWIGNKLSGLDYQQQQFSAHFRYALIRIREYSEQIALYGGENLEKIKLTQAFQCIVSNAFAILELRKRLTFFNNGYNHISLVLGIFLAIPLYLQQKIALGVLMQLSAAFSATIASMAVLMESYVLIAQWRAVVSRLTEFEKTIDAVEAIPSPIKRHSHSSILLRSLNIHLPCGKPLCSFHNLHIPQGSTWLITGPAGSGKSTLLRVLAGIWPYSTGHIYFPKNASTLFLSQKPYLPLGTFRELLYYPGKINVAEEPVLCDILQCCQLESFGVYLDEQRSWSDILSQGEQQRVAFARIFLNRPDIVFLDEATSALDETSEHWLYTQVRQQLPQSTLISVGHRQSLLTQHEYLLSFTSSKLKINSTAACLEELRNQYFT